MSLVNCSAWDSKEHFVSMDGSKSWLFSSHVIVPSECALEVLNFAVSNMQHVQHLTVRNYEAEEVFLLLQQATQLIRLRYKAYLDDKRTKSFLFALRFMPQLEILSMPIYDTFATHVSESVDLLLEPFSMLRLKVLILTMHDPTLEDVELICKAVGLLANSLEVLIIKGKTYRDNSLSSVFEMMQENHFSNLRSLLVMDYGMLLDDQSVDVFCHVWKTMPKLVNVEFCVSDAYVLRVLSTHFESSPCPVRTLCVQLSTYAVRTEDDVKRFFNSLKNTRLQKLRIMFPDDFPPFSALLQSQLVHCGWLRRIELEGLGEDDISFVYNLPPPLTSACLQNRYCRKNCMRACIALMFARTRRKAYAAIGTDVFRMIAQCLFDTRNLRDWDLKDQGAVLHQFKKRMRDVTEESSD